MPPQESTQKISPFKKKSAPKKEQKLATYGLPKLDYKIEKFNRGGLPNFQKNDDVKKYKVKFDVCMTITKIRPPLLTGHSYGTDY